MSEFLGSLWWMLVALGVLVTFHEFGHFWVARRCGVKVLRFSIGFGKPLWTRHGKDGTEYVVAALPLGGYVRMLDEREDHVPAHQLGQAFNRKPVLQRMAIVAAGPAANLLLAFALLWAMLVIGRPDYAPVVGKATGIAAEAGMRSGDRILAVGERKTPTWSEAGMALTVAVLDRQPVALRVLRVDGGESTRTLALDRVPARIDELRAIEATGLVARHQLQPAIVGGINEGTPAWGVLAEGDRITAVDASPVAGFGDIAPAVAALAARGGPGMVEIERDGERLALELTPAPIARPDGSRLPGLGITSGPTSTPKTDAVLRMGPLAAIPGAFRETGF